MAVDGGSLASRARARHNLPISQDLRDRIRKEVYTSLDWERRSTPPGVSEPRSIAASRRVIDSVVSVAESIPSGSLWDRALSGRSDRSLWLRRATCFEDESDRTWDVLSEGGVWVATVSVPGERRLRAVADDFVVTSRRDDLGVVHFGIHDIIH